MEIKNVLDKIPGPLVPEALSKHIVQQSCCKLEPVEILLFQKSFEALAEYTQSQTLSKEALVEVVYTDSDEVVLQRSGLELGQSMPLAVIWLGKIRTQQYPPLTLMQIFLEEICHALYQVQNEYSVKVLVYKILYPHLGGRSLHSLYPLVFDENNFPIPSAYPDRYDDYIASL